ncbi:MAG TPA: PadR family transcriptional regulator [Fimbriimonadaceae bacterium]|nr:PadR family transcriptional regulator [Fimbriimonadaceae bacterium]
MAFRGDMNALILGALAEGPLHGYEIVRKIRNSGGAPKLSEGQIYPYLHKLEEAGYLEANWHTDTGAAPRRVYELTPSGRQELEKQRKEWKRFSESIASILSIKPAKGGSNV